MPQISRIQGPLGPFFRGGKDFIRIISIKTVEIGNTFGDGKKEQCFMQNYQ